jgi:hypothetical protein
MLDNEYEQQEDGSYEQVGTTGGDSFHTFRNNNSTVTYVDSNSGISTTIESQTLGNFGKDFQSSEGNGFMLDSETLGWTGVAAGVIEEGASNATPLIQRNLPAISDAGKVVGNWRITSKAGSQLLNYTRSSAKLLGYGASGISVLADGAAYANGDITGQRFSYRMIATGVGFAAGYFGTGGIGALVTTIGILGEKAYDSWVNDVLPAMRNAIPTGGNLRFPIRR